MALLIRANGKCDKVYPADKDKFTLEEMQGFVAGLIEFIHLKGNRIMVINEEGRLDNLAVNPKATEMLQDEFVDDRVVDLVGDILLCDGSEIS